MPGYPIAVDFEIRCLACERERDELDGAVVVVAGTRRVVLQLERSCGRWCAERRVSVGAKARGA